MDLSVTVLLTELLNLLPLHVGVDSKFDDVGT